jgi:hypothetical protein
VAKNEKHGAHDARLAGLDLHIAGQALSVAPALPPLVAEPADPEPARSAPEPPWSSMSDNPSLQDAANMTIAGRTIATKR